MTIKIENEALLCVTSSAEPRHSTPPPKPPSSEGISPECIVYFPNHETEDSSDSVPPSLLELDDDEREESHGGVVLCPTCDLGRELRHRTVAISSTQARKLMSSEGSTDGNGRFKRNVKGSRPHAECQAPKHADAVTYRG
eukprot:7904633-Ditylum_brightwellii.AAC.1